MMRYAVGVNHSTSQSEIVQWASAGVAEFYFGYMPDAWVRKYGWEVCTNRRPYPTLPHLTDIRQVRKMIRWVHQAEAKAIFAINEHTYPLELAKNIVNMAALMEQEGADALIVSDLSILMMLRASKVKPPVHASIGLGVQNAQAVEFFGGLGIHRFVLPRKVRPDEILSLLQATPKEVEYEIFLLGEWCFYNDQTCFCSHGYGKDEFCHRKKCRGDQSRHAMLNEQYDYAWCGLCLAPMLSDYYDRIFFKIPVRTDVFNGPQVTKQILNMRALPTISREAMIKMMQCQKRYCAYEFE